MKDLKNGRWKMEDGRCRGKDQILKSPVVVVARGTGWLCFDSISIQVQKRSKALPPPLSAAIHNIKEPTAFRWIQKGN